jgi:plasmid stability protein
MISRMSTMIQVRHVPDGLHRRLKARAARAGMSLSDYVLAELERSAARLTREEFLARLRTRTRVDPKESPADAVRAERDSR